VPGLGCGHLGFVFFAKADHCSGEVAPSPSFIVLTLGARLGNQTSYQFRAENSFFGTPRGGRRTVPIRVPSPAIRASAKTNNFVGSCDLNRDGLRQAHSACPPWALRRRKIALHLYFFPCCTTQASYWARGMNFSEAELMAVAQAGRRRAVVEDVAEVAAVDVAVHLHPRHAPAGVRSSRRRMPSRSAW